MCEWASEPLLESEVTVPSAAAHTVVLDRVGPADGLRGVDATARSAAPVRPVRHWRRPRLGLVHPQRHDDVLLLQEHRQLVVGRRVARRAQPRVPLAPPERGARNVVGRAVHRDPEDAAPLDEQHVTVAAAQRAEPAEQRLGEVARDRRDAGRDARRDPRDAGRDADYTACDAARDADHASRDARRDDTDASRDARCDVGRELAGL